MKWILAALRKPISEKGKNIAVLFSRMALSQ